MFFAGLAVAVVLTLFVVWLVRQQLGIKWYEWVIGLLAVSSLFATVQHYFSS
ncbi:dehalogenase, partial [Dehalococcoides mccartyi]